MNTSRPHLIWANKPGCSLAVAEIWIGESDLWLTIFVDDVDKTLKLEVFPLVKAKTPQIMDFMQLDEIIQVAKRDLIVMGSVGG